MTTATPIRTAAPPVPDLAQLAAALSQARDVLEHLASRLDDPDHAVVIRGAEKESLLLSVDVALSEIVRAQRIVAGSVSAP